jgi:CRISPR/Cas system-associated protein Cas5 (RAMP superfamily)
MYANVIIAAKDPDIGYENADLTFKQFVKKLKEQKFLMRQDDLEDALWATKQLADKGKFVSIDDKQDFKEFLNKELPYNMIYYEKYGWIK